MSTQEGSIPQSILPKAGLLLDRLRKQRKTILDIPDSPALHPDSKQSDSENNENSKDNNNKLSTLKPHKDEPQKIDLISPTPVFKKLMKLNTRKVLPDLEDQQSSNDTENSKKPPPPENILSEEGKFLSSQGMATESATNNHIIKPIPISSQNLTTPKNDYSGSGIITPNSNRSLFNFFLKRPKHKMKSKEQLEKEEDDFFEDDIDFEFETAIIKFPIFIISPYGTIRKVWDFLMVIIMVYFGTFLPIRLCFTDSTPNMFDHSFDYTGDNKYYGFDIFIDTVLYLDILIDFVSAYESEAGLLVFSRLQIIKHYLKGWFIIDMLSCFPINSNIFFIEGARLGEKNFNLYSYRIWRLLRLIKLIRVIKINFSIEKVFSLMTLNIDKIKITKHMLSILLFIHLSGCLWNMVAELRQFDTWYDIADNIKDGDIVDKYFTVFYYSIMVTLTIGYGNIHPNSLPERIITIIWMFFGVFLYAYIISALTKSFQKMNITKSIHQEKDYFFRHWAKVFHLPYDTLEMIIKTIDVDDSAISARKMTALSQASSILGQLPKGLYSDIYNYVFKDILNKIDFLKKQPKHFLIKLMPLLRQTHFKRNDIIYKAGDPSLEVFFIAQGRVVTKCLDKYGVPRTLVLVEGSLFGEIDVFFKRNRAQTVRAESICELWMINKKDFLTLLQDFPEIKQDLEVVAQAKEFYRKPIDPTYKKKTPLIHLKTNYFFRDLDVNAGSEVFNALSRKMQKKIQKGTHLKTRDRREYESLDFEPDLPSPERQPKAIEVLTEAEWDTWEKNMTKKLVRKARKKTTKIYNQLEIQEKIKKRNSLLKTGIKETMIRRYSRDLTESVKMDKRNSLIRSHSTRDGKTPDFASGSSPKNQDFGRRRSIHGKLDLQGSIKEWQIENRAKQEVTQELRDGSGEQIFKDSLEIDRFNNIPVKLNMISHLVEEEQDKLVEIDKMLEYAKGMIVALDSYEYGLNDVLMTYDLEYDNSQNGDKTDDEYEEEDDDDDGDDGY